MDAKQFDDVIARWGQAVEPIDRPRMLEAGFSGMIGVRYRSAAGEWIVKGHLPEKVSPERLERVHRLGRYAALQGCLLLPRVLPLPSGATVCRHAGRIWELQAVVQGSGDWAGEPSREKVLAAIRGLARLHVAAGDFGTNRAKAGPAPCARVRLERLRSYRQFAAQVPRSIFDKFSDRRFAGLASQVVDGFVQEEPMLRASLQEVAEIEVPIGPALRDVRPCDVFFLGDEVSGFVDPTAAELDFPLTDVVRLVAESWESGVSWTEALATYREAGPLPAEGERLLLPLERSSRWISMLNWVRWVMFEGRSEVSLDRATARLIRLWNRPPIPWS